MVERPIKVDEPTDRLVTDLAYFLGSSKKAIVRDAVAEFAETHHPRLLGGRGDGLSASDGIGSDDGIAAGDGIAGADGVASDAGRADDAGRAGDAGSASDAWNAGGAGRADDAWNAGGAGRASGDELAEARARGVTFEALDPLDRLALRRRELVRRFAERGGTNVRVLDPTLEPGASAESPTRIVLLAETDPVDGSAAVPALEEVARQVLGVHATVVSLTALRLFGSGRDERALAQSRPL